MGKRLIQQRRGRGTSRYKSPGHRFKGEVRYPNEKAAGIIKDIINCPGHDYPLLQIKYGEGRIANIVAAEGLKQGDNLYIGAGDIKAGNVLHLKDIPEGTQIFNIEISPFDGGKLVRSAGSSAKVMSRYEGNVTVLLPSKKQKIFNDSCRASIGTVAGGGRGDKPLLKAGKAHHIRKAKNRLYPRVSGTSMNAVDHPFGGSKSTHKGRPTVAPKHAPAGRKVGKIRPRRTGKR